LLNQIRRFAFACGAAPRAGDGGGGVTRRSVDQRNSLLKLLPGAVEKEAIFSLQLAVIKQI